MAAQIFRSQRVWLVPVLLALALLAGCATPSGSINAGQATTGAACYQPGCCEDGVALQFEPHRLNCRAIALRGEGRDAESFAALRAAIVAARAETTRKQEATEVLCYALNDAAHRADAGGDDDESRLLFDANLAACKARFGEHSDQAAQALYGGASQHLLRDRLDVAQQQMQQVIAWSRDNGNRGLESFATDALGRILDMKGNRVEGRRLLQQAIAIKNAVFGERSHEVAVSCTNLGASYVEAGEGATGREWYRRAIAIYGETLGETHDRTLEVAAALVSSHLADGELKQAERMYESLMPKFVRTYGETSERTVVLVNDWGATLARQERYAEALVKFEQSLVIRRTTIPNTVRHGYSALNAAKMKKVTSNCAAAQPLRNEAGRVAAAMTPAQRRNAEIAEFVADVAAFETECAAKGQTPSASGKKK